MTLQELSNLYNSTKTADTTDSSKITSSFTLKGLDEVKSMVAAAMLEIDKFTSNGHKQSAIASFGSKALSIVPFVNTYFAGKIDAAKTEAIQQQSITQIVETLRNNVEAKRNEVIDCIQDLASIKTNMLSRLATYTQIDAEASTIVANAQPHTRELFDAQQLATMVKHTITKIETDISSYIDPLLAAATISVNQIQSIMPTLENDLQSKLSIGAFQQQLADLNSTVQAITQLASNAGDKIRSSVNETIYQSISMLGETGLDIKAIERHASEELAHQKRIQQAMADTSTKINENYKAMTRIQSTLIENKSKLNNSLISQYTHCEDIIDV